MSSGLCDARGWQEASESPQRVPDKRKAGLVARPVS